jgi:hypothetical protein
VKKPKIAKKPRKVRGPKPAVSTKAGSNAMDPDKRQLFLKDKEDYAKAMKKLATAQSGVRTLGKTIKADGFTLRQIKLAIQLDTPEGEAEFKSLIANDLLAAQYAGAPIGAQLQLFMEPDRTPAVDIAASEGQADAMGNKIAKPSYDPSTKQHAAYLNAYHAEQARQLKAGIKPLKDGDPPRATSEMN